jgi:hypothetical protein
MVIMIMLLVNRFLILSVHPLPLRTRLRSFFEIHFAIPKRKRIAKNKEEQFKSCYIDCTLIFLKDWDLHGVYFAKAHFNLCHEKCKQLYGIWQLYY